MKVVLIILSLFLLSSCVDRKPKDYYIVGKEYKSGGMCCDNKRKHYIYMGVYVPVTTAMKHKHVKQSSVFTIHIARPYEVKSFTIDSSRWVNYKLGQKLTK